VVREHLARNEKQFAVIAAALTEIAATLTARLMPETIGQLLDSRK
jgi:hypothetical protein